MLQRSLFTESVGSVQTRLIYISQEMYDQFRGKRHPWYKVGRFSSGPSSYYCYSIAVPVSAITGEIFNPFDCDPDFLSAMCVKVDLHRPEPQKNEVRESHHRSNKKEQTFDGKTAAAGERPD